MRNVACIAVRHESIGKGPVLHEVCRAFGITPGEVLVIGDSCNDLSMLDGGFGFAAAVPGNAEDEVKARVKAIGGYIAQDGYGDGVAEAVRRGFGT
ncbi:HAD family hydrolase [Paenibacillus ginsengarvi]|uniref:HAD family hydrolase n=1 Tax=Paenibacillus ginsengarvi TaxID=400777 RepID=UPI001315AB7A|nr:HAD hydrolase family protein [Paenibacillus ginsengarvi]